MNQLSNIISIGDRAIDVLLKHQTLNKLHEVDILIEPVINPILSIDLTQRDELITMGEKAAREVIEKIRELTN